MLKVLLSNIDEKIFSNIFAVGLREMQELGTLSDGEAAEFLYNLSAGVDRVSLVDVLRELESSRNRILDRNGGPCQVAQLLAEREKLRQEIEQLDDLMHRYGQLAAGRLQLDREVARLEEEKNTAEYESRVIELAIGLRDRWRRRDAMDDELAALGPQAPLPPDAIRRLDALNARIRKHQQQREELRRQRQELRSEAAGAGGQRGPAPAGPPHRGDARATALDRRAGRPGRRAGEGTRRTFRGRGRRAQGPRTGRAGRPDRAAFALAAHARRAAFGGPGRAWPAGRSGPRRGRPPPRPKRRPARSPRRSKPL